MTHDDYLRNILSVFTTASDDSYDDGMNWYDGAHALALSLSPDNVSRGAGVLAAFSATTKWRNGDGSEGQNITLARNLFSTGIASGHTKLFCSLAYRIYCGEDPDTVLKGDKQRAFYHAILSPSTSTVATIDRHAHDIAMGRFYNDSERKIGKRLFRAMSAAYIEAAELSGIGVAQMQAVTWVSWKKRRAISDYRTST